MSLRAVESNENGHLLSGGRSGAHNTRALRSVFELKQDGADEQGAALIAHLQYARIRTFGLHLILSGSGHAGLTGKRPNARHSRHEPER